MTGILLLNYYTNKKSILTYFSIGVIICIFFSIYVPLTSSFFLMMLMTTPATDNLKHDKETKWVNFIPTLPITRTKYIYSQFLFYLLLTLISLLISEFILISIQNDIYISIISGIIGMSAVLQFSIVYPLTFKLGTDKSNIIFMITSFIVIFIFFIFYYGLFLINTSSWESISLNFAHNLLLSLLYLCLGIIIFVLSLIATIIIFKKSEL
ncbi:ABC-2 family transporter [Staphylococcus hominis]